MKSVIFQLMLLLAVKAAWAQDTSIRIKGVVTNIEQLTVNGAIITAQNARVKYNTVSSNDGSFMLAVLPGSYTISIVAEGYDDYEKELFILKDTVMWVELIKTKTKQLENIEVKAERPLMQQEIDKTIIHVEKLIGAGAGNIYDMLDKVPGITVENNGGIALYGKESVLVLINGKETMMSAADLTSYLRSLPASMVETVELMPNPPAKYAATGTSVINIVLKKEKRLGVMSTINTGANQGKFFRGNSSFSSNVNTAKWGLLANVAAFRDAGFNETDNKQVVVESGKALRQTNQQGNRSFWGTGWSGRVAVDYSLGKRTTLAAMVNYNSSRQGEKNEYVSTWLAEEQITRISRGYSNQPIRSAQWMMNGSISHKLNEKGQLLTMDYNRTAMNRTTGYQLFRDDEWIHAADQKEKHHYDLPFHIKINSWQADYYLPLKRIVIEAGSRYGNVLTDYLYQHAINRNGLDIGTVYNHFIYEEGIAAAYTTLAANRKRWGLKVGLRAEHTKIKGDNYEQQGAVSGGFKRKYFDVFPSVFISRSIDSTGARKFVLSYVKRINRPNYQQLNPFLIMQDDYNFWSGNPALQPVYMHAVELKYQHKSSWNIAANYAYFNNISFATVTRRDSLFYTRPENVATGIAIGIIFSGTQKINSWWTLIGNLNMIRLYLNNPQMALKQELYTGRIHVINQVKIAEKWRAEIAIQYRHKDINGQVYTNPRFRTNIGVNYVFWQDKASIRFFADDLLYTWKDNGYIKGIENTSAVFSRQMETRMAGFSFSYRFGKTRYDRQMKAEKPTEESQRL